MTKFECFIHNACEFSVLCYGLRLDSINDVTYSKYMCPVHFSQFDISMYIGGFSFQSGEPYSSGGMSLVVWHYIIPKTHSSVFHNALTQLKYPAKKNEQILHAMLNQVFLVGYWRRGLLTSHTSHFHSLAVHLPKLCLIPPIPPFLIYNRFFVFAHIMFLNNQIMHCSSRDLQLQLFWFAWYSWKIAHG